MTSGSGRSKSRAIVDPISGFETVMSDYGAGMTRSNYFHITEFNLLEAHHRNFDYDKKLPCLLFCPALELLLHIAAEAADGVRAALPAVLHLLDDLAQLLLDLPLLLR